MKGTPSKAAGFIFLGVFSQFSQFYFSDTARKPSVGIGTGVGDGDGWSSVNGQVSV
jgi:hypothetical protein